MNDIEKLENFKTITILYGNTFVMHTEQLKEIQESIGNVLADLYEANNRINDLLDIVKQKDELIKQLCIGIREHDSLEDDICPLTEPLDCHDINKDGTCIECIIEFYKRGVSK